MVPSCVSVGSQWPWFIWRHFEENKMVCLLQESVVGFHIMASWVDLLLKLPLFTAHWLPLSMMIYLRIIASMVRCSCSSSYVSFHPSSSRATQTTLSMTSAYCAQSLNPGDFPGVVIGHTWNFHTKFRSLVLVITTTENCVKFKFIHMAI